MYENKTINPEHLRIGSKVDEHLFSGEEGDEETKKYIKTTRAYHHFSDVVQHPDAVAQYEWYGDFYDLPWKCMFDTLIPGVMFMEFKTLKINNYEQFMRLIDMLDYDRQCYVYQHCSEVPLAQIVGVTKHKIPLMFSTYIKPGDELWYSGKRKTEFLLQLLKSMI